MSVFKFELGQKVKDGITGLTGTLTARCQYISGSNRYCLESISGGRHEENWLDEERLEIDEHEEWKRKWFSGEQS